MTERMPLGFDFNKQFKSQNFRGNILLMFQTLLFFQASPKSANPALLVAFLGLFLSIKQTLQTPEAIMTTAECRQLSPLEVQEGNSKSEPKKLREIQIDQYGQTKGCYRGF